MILPVDQNMLYMETKLVEEKNAIIIQKQQLLEEFKKYAQKKLKEQGKIIDIKYKLMNNEEDLVFRNLEMGSDFKFERINFSYDPKTDLVSNYSTEVYIGTKKTDSFLENINVQPKRTMYQDFSLTRARQLDQEKVALQKKKITDKILMGIFQGELVFDDEEYKFLVRKNIALEQEYQRVNKRLNALDITNKNFQQDNETKRK